MILGKLTLRRLISGALIIGALAIQATPMVHVGETLTVLHERRT